VFAASVVRFWHDDLARARDAYESMAAAARELGDESSLPYIYVMLGQIDCALGRFEDALHLLEQGHAIAEQAGQRALVGYTLSVRALAQAHLGRTEEATSAASRALEIAQETNGVPAWIFATWAVGHLALAQGDPVNAYETMSVLVGHHRREAIREPGALPFLPDAAEALVEAGRLEDAEELLGEYGAAAEHLARRRGIAATQHVGGLLAAARGDLEGAVAALAAAVALYSAGDTPFERARSLLALGATQRRMKRRREARATLEEALAVFEGIGAEVWAQRARAELKRISGRAATPGALTPAEERVAALVAEGKTNREVAAALFLSDRTVEGHLARIFGKLGIRHRTEIAAALASRQTQGISAPNTGDSPVSAAPSAL
jgi:DNA-binding CsgD family transcriptional regulator